MVTVGRRPRAVLQVFGSLLIAVSPSRAMGARTRSECKSYSSLSRGAESTGMTRRKYVRARDRRSELEGPATPPFRPPISSANRGQIIPDYLFYPSIIGLTWQIFAIIAFLRKVLLLLYQAQNINYCNYSKTIIEIILLCY